MAVRRAARSVGVGRSVMPEADAVGRIRVAAGTKRFTDTSAAVRVEASWTVLTASARNAPRDRMCERYKQDEAHGPRACKVQEGTPARGPRLGAKYRPLIT